MRHAIQQRVLSEPVFFVSILMAALSSFFSSLDLQAIDWKVIIALFNLMAVYLWS